MGMFLITPINEPEKLGSAIKSSFGNDAYQIPRNGAWLVSFNGTAKELSDRVGVTPSGQNGTAIVVSIVSYYGRAPTDIWEWMKVRMERD